MIRLKEHLMKKQMELDKYEYDTKTYAWMFRNLSYNLQ